MKINILIFMNFGLNNSKNLKKICLTNLAKFNFKNL